MKTYDAPRLRSIRYPSKRNAIDLGVMHSNLERFCAEVSHVDEPEERRPVVIELPSFLRLGPRAVEHIELGLPEDAA